MFGRSKFYGKEIVKDATIDFALHRWQPDELEVGGLDPTSRPKLRVRASHIQTCPRIEKPNQKIVMGLTAKSTLCLTGGESISIRSLRFDHAISLRRETNFFE